MAVLNFRLLFAISNASLRLSLFLSIFYHPHSWVLIPWMDTIFNLVMSFILGQSQVVLAFLLIYNHPLFMCPDLSVIDDLSGSCLTGTQWKSEHFMQLSIPLWWKERTGMGWYETDIKPEHTSSWTELVSCTSLTSIASLLNTKMTLMTIPFISVTFIICS